MIQFEVGLTYYSDLTLVCIKRTNKTVSFQKLNGEIIRKSCKLIQTSRAGYESIYEYISFGSFEVTAKDVIKKKVRKDEPIQTPYNTHLFVNGVYLDPAVEF